MPTLTIKNIPDELYNALKKQAELNQRSLNNEAIMSLSLVVNNHRTLPQHLLTKARDLRIKKNSAIKLTDDVINNAKQQGRL